MRLAPSRAISSSVSVISPACTEAVSVDGLSMGAVSFPPPASGVFVCWAHAEGYAALFHPIKSRDPQLLRIPRRYGCPPSAPHRLHGFIPPGRCASVLPRLRVPVLIHPSALRYLPATNAVGRRPSHAAVHER